MPLLSDVPELEGWTLLSDVARELGVSRQALYEAADRALRGVRAGSQALRPITVRKIGKVRPVYLMRTAEIPQLRASLSADAQRRGRMAGGSDEAEVPAADTAVAAVTSED